MARIDVPDGKGLERERLLMMQPDVAIGMGAHAQAVYEKTSLPAREREIARLRVAVANGCPVCLNTRSPKAEAEGLDEDGVQDVIACSIGQAPEIEGLTERERLAGEFADRFATDHHSIDDDLMNELRTHFSDVEIIELTALCAMTVGNGRFMTVLDIAADDDGFYILPEGD
ncbi:MAG: carboxymuconolactone decarboxylase family protein [Acidimicrobiales bacterium]|jgi:AhpD family alkylhydroperoxidase|nr:carboxymuconolactone decarboxylase family protein [Acidimicrobiales bacterium]